MTKIERWLIQITIAIGVALYSAIYIFMLAIGQRDILNEYVKNNYQGLLAYDDALYFLFMLGVLIVMVVLAVKYMHNFVSLVIGIFTCGIILCDNILFSMRHPQILNIFSGWESVLIVGETLTCIGIIIFSIGYIIWYIRNRRKKGQNDGE